MADRISPLQRSYNMSMIKSKDTQIEILARKYLYHLGIRYRKNYNLLPGKPDIAITSKKTAVFIHGCFWHGHAGCRYAVIPKTRTNYWSSKIRGNIERDQRNEALLLSMGWHVFVVWECELKRNIEEAMQPIVNSISNTNTE